MVKKNSHTTKFFGEKKILVKKIWVKNYFGQRTIMHKTKQKIQVYMKILDRKKGLIIIRSKNMLEPKNVVPKIFSSKKKIFGPKISSICFFWLKKIWVKKHFGFKKVLIQTNIGLKLWIKKTWLKNCWVQSFWGSSNYVS